MSRNLSKDIKQEILELLTTSPQQSSREIHEGLKTSKAYATIKRALADLLQEKYIVTTGQGKATKYSIGPAYRILYPIDVEQYFGKEIDERQINGNFDFSVLEVVNNIDMFTIRETEYLNALQGEFMQNVSHLEIIAYDKEMERLAIDLSWKSSQIEGNTYSLLETERLLKEQETAEGKPKDDATMLLNHKEAIEFVIKYPDYVVPLTVSSIEDIHSILIKNLGVNRNIRQHRVGISGTNYKPLDNEHQIKEALTNMCRLINNKENVFEKALLALLLLSYTQAFVDGNKRTARIVSNAILIAHRYCPISFRTADAVEYKKAMLLFYEQNNISAFKKIFIDQFAFAVKTYF